MTHPREERRLSRGQTELQRETAAAHEMKDIMVDIETLATTVDATVVSVGAVRFDLTSRDRWEDLTPARCFRMVLDTNQGRKVCPETMMWWAQQSDDVRKVLTEDSVDLRLFRAGWDAFCHGAHSLWGNGPTFDNAILRHLYAQNGWEFPIPFRGDMCCRTLRRLAREKGSIPPTESIPAHIKHEALDDAKRQVLHAQRNARHLL